MFISLRSGSKSSQIWNRKPALLLHLLNLGVLCHPARNHSWLPKTTKAMHCCSRSISYIIHLDHTLSCSMNWGHFRIPVKSPWDRYNCPSFSDAWVHCRDFMANDVLFLKIYSYLFLFHYISSYFIHFTSFFFFFETSPGQAQLLLLSQASMEYALVKSFLGWTIPSPMAASLTRWLTTSAA